MARLKKNELIRRVSKRLPGMAHDHVQRVSNRLIDTLIQTLKDGGRVEIRGFGVFFTRECGARFLRSPLNGEMMEVEAKRIPRFKAGKELKQQVNAQARRP